MEFDRFIKRLINLCNVLVRKAALVANIDFGFLQSEKEGRRSARIMWAKAKDRLFFFWQNIYARFVLFLCRDAHWRYTQGFFFSIKSW